MTALTHCVASRAELLRKAIRNEVDCRCNDAEAALAGLEDVVALRALVEWAVLGTDQLFHRRWRALVVGVETEPVLRRNSIASISS